MKKIILKKTIFSLLLMVLWSIENHAKNNDKEIRNVYSLSQHQEPILNINQKAFLYFNGSNDYGNANVFLEGLERTTIMGWISLSPQFENYAFIMGENNFNISCDANRKIIVKCNSAFLTSTISLDTSRWYHIAASYDGSIVKFYLNGNLINQQAANGSIGQTLNSSFTIGKNPINNIHFFQGKMDEIRIFNKNLTDYQIQQMVYQEITNHNGMIRGAVIPKNIPGLNYNSLIRYYKMDLIQNNLVQNQTQNNPNVIEGIQLFNINIVGIQEAPMPFLTKINGDFPTAIHDDEHDIFGKDAENYPWSIIQVSNDITQYENIGNFGLIVDSGKKITMLNDTKIENSGYLKLNGQIDLEGESQLIQTTESELDPTSSGTIERDQQGQSNKYNYNYWSSPVSTPNTSSINHGYTVAEVMKDGSIIAQPQNIGWVSGMNNPTTSNPITLSSYWIFKFQNLTPDYANWASVGQNGLLLAGQGYTLKGSGATSGSQNFTFIGKPNNGQIINIVSANNLNLTGNPYPSALDADKFIKDNLATINGTLYFWEHFKTNNTHTLGEYQGGYAVRTLVGGTAPMSPADISELGSSIRIPGRFIPVGQGFFVTGNATGGNIIFDNNQRLFVKESNIDSNSLFRANQNATAPNSGLVTNEEDPYTENAFMKFRIGFNSNNNFHRQLLIGFMDDLATESVDPGYDAIHIDNQQYDMYFLNNGTKLIIQGASHFETSKVYPLGIKTYVAGDVQFTLDGLENVEPTQPIYIHDIVTGLYHDIRNEHFTINLPQGEIHNRFELTFQNHALSASDFELGKQITVAYTNAQNLLTIKNNLTDVTVKTVSIFTILGQTLATWNVENQTQNNISLPISNLSAGPYIVRVKTTHGTISKKIIIK